MKQLFVQCQEAAFSSPGTEKPWADLHPQNAPPQLQEAFSGLSPPATLPASGTKGSYTLPPSCGLSLTLAEVRMCFPS